jgi:hypothetical protein
LSPVSLQDYSGRFSSAVGLHMPKCGTQCSFARSMTVPGSMRLKAALHSSRGSGKTHWTPKKLFSAVCKKATLGVEIWEPKQREAAVRDRLSLRHRGLAALVTAMALCGAASAASLHAKKGHAHKPLMQQSVPPPVHYIHCAMGLGQGPCGPDPAMQQLYVDPPIIFRPAPPFDQPDIAPGR